MSQSTSSPALQFVYRDHTLLQIDSSRDASQVGAFDSWLCIYADAAIELPVHLRMCL